MKKLYINLFFIAAWVIPLLSLGQSTLKGTVKDVKGLPLSYANVYLQGSGDGTSTDSAGYFGFNTALKDSQVLLVSDLGYTSYSYPLILKGGEYKVQVVLKSSQKVLNEVVINAGSIAASNDNAVAILKPLDIVTIAGGQADIAGAIQTLSGVQRNGGATKRA